ncbi:MAG: hypothetical protein Q4B26_18475 [Eubacteriales bacterium]|nr:hypothetical protein [Eubacteriales bacterium]
MLLFSTILDVNKELTKENFIELVSLWNQSAKYKENIVLGVSWNGERNIKFGTDKLSVEIIDYPEKDILAVRHEKITADEVVWDTDFVVNFAERKIAIRLDRTFSEDALEMNAAFSTPHFISLLIEHGYLQDDQDLPVLRDPIMITDSNLKTVQQVITNKEYYELPVVYVAKDFADQDPLSISWLASRLKGAAHVLVEESKETCRKCTEICGETVEEYGAVRIYYPSLGVNRKRFLFRSATGNMDVRLEKVIRHVIQYWNSQRMDILYTWQGVNSAVMSDTLQNQIQRLTEAESAKQSAEEEINLVYEEFDEDIKSLQKKLEELSRANEALQMENFGLRAKMNASDAMPIIYQGDEEDFYPEEVKDMVLGVLADALNNTEKGTRLYDVLEDILANNPYQHLSDERKQRVKNLFKGYKTLTGAMRQELMSLGFEISDDGKHYKITYQGDPRYMVTIGKTPSDNRAGSNNAGMINKIML